jgi:hypothetical protein
VDAGGFAGRSSGAHYTALSDETGLYHLLGLPVGLPARELTLTVTHSGFQAYQRSGLTLRFSDRIPFDVQLEVGTAAEAVQVTAAAPLLQSAGGEVGFNVDSKRVEGLPLDRRNFLPLTALSAGVALPNGSFLR